jgi:hypothetical protein
MDLQCEGGALFGRHNEFATEIESAFLKVLRSGAEAKWQDPPVEYFIIEELWNAAHAEYDGENSFVRLNKSIFWSFMIQLLEETGAESYPGRVEFQGGPGMSSEISILYADEPDAVIDEALRSLRSLLS